MVTGLSLEGNRVTGVDYRRPAAAHRSVDAGEVILCGGAINSPQLLQLSGIGNAGRPRGARHRRGRRPARRGRATSRTTSRSTSSTPPSSRSRSRPWLKHRHKPRIGAEWLFLRSGVGATNHFEAGGFIRSNDDVDYPNLMFHFLPIAIRYDGSRPAAEHGYQVHIGPMYSDARGTVKIKSTRPYEHPALRFNYLSTENDRREWIEMVRAARHILNQPAFDAVQRRRDLARARRCETDQEILDWVAEDAETALHPSCTAQMGADDMSRARPGDDAGARRRRAAGRRRLGRCPTSPTATSTRR